MATAIIRSEALLLRACGGQYGPLLTALLGLCLAAPGLTGERSRGPSSTR